MHCRVMVLKFLPFESLIFFSLNEDYVPSSCFLYTWWIRFQTFFFGNCLMQQSILFSPHIHVYWLGIIYLVPYFTRNCKYTTLSISRFLPCIRLGNIICWHKICIILYSGILYRFCFIWLYLVLMYI